MLFSFAESGLCLLLPAEKGPSHLGHLRHVNSLSIAIQELVVPSLEAVHVGPPCNYWIAVCPGSLVPQVRRCPQNGHLVCLIRTHRGCMATCTDDFSLVETRQYACSEHLPTVLGR